MRKLENIPKQNIFKVPDGYFESLPLRVQARVALKQTHKDRSFIFRYNLQYVLPAAALIAIALYWFAPAGKTANVEALLATIQTEQLVIFLGESDISTEDLIEGIEFNATDIEAIESEAYSLGLNDEDLHPYLNDDDLDNL